MIVLDNFWTISHTFWVYRWYFLSWKFKFENFWVPSTLFVQNTLHTIKPVHAKNSPMNLHVSHVYVRCCYFPRKPTNLHQCFHAYWLKFPLLIPKCFMAQKFDISAFKRTFNYFHISVLGRGCVHIRYRQDLIAGLSHFLKTKISLIQSYCARFSHSIWSLLCWLAFFLDANRILTPKIEEIFWAGMWLGIESDGYTHSWNPPPVTLKGPPLCGLFLPVYIYAIYRI